MKGFKFAGIHAGIKKTSVLDLGIIVSDQPCTAAGVFTQNKVVAPPVVLGRQRIKNGVVQAILVNSGNANCFTGNQGYKDALNCAALVADHFQIPEDQIIVASTGVIGQPLPMGAFQTGIPQLHKELSEDKMDDFATAILTTDTCKKIVSKTIRIKQKQVTLTGVAKGSGMIRPDMATMLAFICTDALISSDHLQGSLASACDRSFNRISVDGDTSTNDSLFALANGRSGIQIDNETDLNIFNQALTAVCLELARKIVADGEGATKCVQINVIGAIDQKDAYKVCDAIAHSCLVKTAFYGEDPNWGRIIAAAGRSGAQIDPDRLDLYVDQSPLVLKGRWLGLDAEKKVARIMKDNEIDITLNLHLGKARDFYIFCDFSEDYVKINADYRT
jgi:glutamate N-acetyltransferase/amino-acid N-acetyltransferase